jgi:HD-like signal output (HDOD) protein
MILGGDMVPSQKIEAMSRHIAKLVAFPFTVTKVLQLSNDPKAGAADLGKAIAADPAISTHLLKVANSVFFASVNRRIGSIKEAIVRIGFSETKRIVMGMSVMNLFSQVNKNLGFDRTDFWYHSLATGLMAERTAKCFGDISTEEAFIAGLLHDLGILFLDDFFPQVLGEVLSLTAREAGLFYDVEMKRLNVSHLDLIADLFPKWKIPQQITDAIVGQYSVLSLDRPPESISEKLAACVAIGNMTAKMLHLGRECDEFIKPVSNLLLEFAKMPAGITAGIIGYLQTQMTTFRAFLGLEPREYGCNCPEGLDPKKFRIGICNFDRSIIISPVVDLQNEGVKCEMLRSDLPASEYNGKYHALILWSVSGLPPEQVKPYTLLSPAPVIDDDTPDADKRVPVFLFCPDSTAPERYPGCMVMAPAFDLRLFETSLSGAFEQQSAADTAPPLTGTR